MSDLARTRRSPLLTGVYVAPDRKDRTQPANRTPAETNIVDATATASVARAPRATAEQAPRATAEPVLEAANSDRAPVAERAVREPEPSNTVTLDKIGAFLELDFGRLLVWIRQSAILILVLAVLGALAGGAYALLSKPRFTVATDIMIDPGNLQVVDSDLYSKPGQVDNQVLQIGSKQRILTSRNVLSRVVADLDLANDREFYDPNGSGVGLSLGGASALDDEAALIALRRLSERVSSEFDEKSFVVTLSVSSEETGKAIAISDSIVRAFKQELAEAESEGAAKAAASLDNRLDELKASVQDAEERVQSFRRQNNLAANDSGQLLSTQFMVALNVQVASAQARVIEAQSNYDALIETGQNANPPDGNGDRTLISLLRDRAATLEQQYKAQSNVLGERHPSIVSLAAEVDAAKAQVRDEITRLVAAAKSTLQEAQANLDALTSKAESLSDDVFVDNELQVQLRELERDAASKTAVYESYLSRTRQITEREQIDTTNVRVISSAVPPKARSWPPRTAVVIIAGGVAGLFLGLMGAIGLGIVRDMRRPASQPAPQA